MRYEKGHKEATRRRIVETAARRFREEGIAAVGVANLMSEIGLTQGGFYNHFASKEELAREALALGLEGMRERMRKARSATGEVSFERVVDSYLSESHRDNAGRGCMLTTLAIEAARDNNVVRAQMSDGIARMIALISATLPESVAPAQRESKAMAVVANLIGSMILARATDDPQVSDRLLEAGRHTASAIVEAAS